MAYTKTNWVNDSQPPISADNLNNMENGIFNANALADNIDDAYDDTATYAVGDYAIYDNTLYKCTTAVTSAEPFDSSKWSSVSVMDEIGQNASAISALNSSIDAINNTHIRGLKWKTFSYTYNAATVAGNVYSVASAKQTVFGLTASDTIVGISITSAGGNNNNTFTIPLYSAYNDMFVFKPDASNTSLTGFGGVVFYQ